MSQPNMLGNDMHFLCDMLSTLIGTTPQRGQAHVEKQSLFARMLLVVSPLVLSLASLAKPRISFNQDTGVRFGAQQAAIWAVSAWMKVSV